MFFRAGIRERRSRRELDQKINIVINSQIANEERFASNEERFARNEERFASNEERFARNEERFARNEERYARNEERFARYEERFAGIEDRFDRTDAEIRALIDAQIQTEHRLAALIEIVTKERNGRDQ